MRKSYHITPLSVAKYDIMLKALYRALYVEYHRIVYTSALAQPEHIIATCVSGIMYGAILA